MKRRIFVVDDDRDNAESIADLLELRGFEVALAHSGEEAILRFKDAEFDLVLLDVKLPGINGVDTFFELRKLQPDAAVMMMTGYSLEELVANAIAHGALGVLRKPFAVSELLKLLGGIGPRGTVLLADDDADFVASIVPILRNHGYAVEVAKSGEEALEMALSSPPSCLVLDLRMPGLSGLDVHLRLKAAGFRVPTIVVTGFVDEDHTAVSRLRPVAEGLLAKPFDPADLLRTLDTVTGNRAA